MNKIKHLAKKQAEKMKQLYDIINSILMVCVLVALFISDKIAILVTISLVIGLIASNSLQTKILILENEMMEDTVDKYVK